VQLWELIAREQIRDTLARYNYAGDAGRPDDLAATFCADGVLEIRGLPPVTGRSEIAAFLGGVTDKVAADAQASARHYVRHNVTNVVFADLTPERAEVSSYFTVLTHIGLDHYGRYRDVLIPAGEEWLIRHRRVTTDWAAPESSMAREPRPDVSPR
jgi:SnoaL-like domain